jgi:hypothetical protein
MCDCESFVHAKFAWYKLVVSRILERCSASRRCHGDQPAVPDCATLFSSRYQPKTALPTATNSANKAIEDSKLGTFSFQPYWYDVRTCCNRDLVAAARSQIARYATLCSREIDSPVLWCPKGCGAMGWLANGPCVGLCGACKVGNRPN